MKRTMKEKIEKWGTVTGALLVVAGASAVVTLNLDSMLKKRRTSPNQIQQGYVNPNKLEIAIADSDGVRGNEVYLNYKGKSYLFLEDENGKPNVVNYRIKPTKPVEIIPEEGNRK